MCRTTSVLTVPDPAAAERAFPVSLELVGGFRLTVAAHPVEPPIPVQRMLAVLALNAKPLQRPYLAGLLWPTVPEERARGNLRSTLWRLGIAQDIVMGKTHLMLRPHVEVDVDRMNRIAGEVIAGGAALVPSTLESLLARGEILPDWYDDWLTFERERFNQMRLLALDSLGRQLLRRHRVSEATAAALAAVQIEALRESSQRLLIECFIADGNRVAALRQFRIYGSMLRQEMGLRPSEELSGLVADLVA